MKIDRQDRKVKNIEISAGLIVGYLIMAGIGVLFYGKDPQKAFFDEKIMVGIAGVALSIFLLVRSARNKE